MPNHLVGKKKRLRTQLVVYILRTYDKNAKICGEKINNSQSFLSYNDKITIYVCLF